MTGGNMLVGHDDDDADDGSDDDEDNDLGMGDAVRLTSVYGSPMAVLTCWE